MKRIISVLIILFALCGCTKGRADVDPVTRGISFSCDATYYNETYECDCEIQKNGDTTISFNYPEEVKGLNFTFSRNGVAANYNGIEYINDKIVFENSVAGLIYEVLSTTDDVVFEKDDVFYTEGVTDNFEYRLELGATGLPIKITTKPDAAQVIFKNMKIK